MTEHRPPHILHRGVWPRLLGIATLGLGSVLVLALLAGCGGEEEDELPIQTYEITVTDDGIEPDRVRLRIPERARVVVENESDQPCAFNFGPYVRETMVEPGDTFSIEFTAFEVDVDLAADGPLTMGCEDEARQGTIELLGITGSDDEP